VKRLTLTSAMLHSGTLGFQNDTKRGREAEDAISALLPESSPAFLPKRPRSKWQSGSQQGRMAYEADLQGRYLAPKEGTAYTRLTGTTLLLEDATGALGLKRTDLCLPAATRDQHLLIVGKTGSGKTTRAILPLIAADLADPTRSLVVLDAKGDLTAPVLELARHYRGKRARVRYLCFTDPERSVAWNPVAGITTRQQAQALAHCLTTATPAGKDETPFFQQQAAKWIAAFIRGIQDRPEQASLGTLRALFDLPPSQLLTEVKALGLTDLEALLSSLVQDNRNAETVQMELANALLPWEDEAVCTVTSTHELEFSELTRTPTVWILRFPEGEERLLALHTLFVQRLLESLLRTADRHANGRLPRPVSLIADEFGAALGKLPGIERKINTFRSRRLSFTAAVQTLSQLEEVYGSVGARTLLAGFGSLLLLPPVDMADAQYAAQRSGPMLAEWAESAGDGSGRVVREALVERTIFTSSDIALPPVHPTLGPPATLLLPDAPPLMLYLPPLHMLPEWQHWQRGDDGTGGPCQRHTRRRKKLLQATSITPEPSAVSVGGLPPGISDTRRWSEEQIRTKLEAVKKKLDWDNTTGSARKWWEAFEVENKNRMNLVLHLAEELQNRRATITEFFLAYVYSNTENIQANLCYLDYTRLKKEEDKKRREAAAKDS